MNALNSLATVDQVNYLTFVEKFDPDIYMIRIALQETGVNPIIIPQIIRVLANMTYGTGYGKIQIFMQARLITQIKGEESTEINQSAIIDSKLNGVYK